ncbi:MAG: metal ABC transporter permease [Chloroflexi bacterium]|nr:MAG: metal ABC transporter permease [Chloroflexota bacterium]
MEISILEIIRSMFFDYTVRTVVLGAAVLGIASGALGSFAVLRKQSLLGDAMSHAALPGIVLIFILTRSKAPLVIMAGAVIAGWVGALVMSAIVNTTRIKHDSALGFVLSVFFGLGLMLLTFVQKIPDARQAGLEKFLFGQAAALLERDVIAMAILGGLAMIVMVVFWKEFKLLSFDAPFAASLGFPVRLLDIVLTTLLVIAIVIGLQAVGVVLMSAMVVAPAAAARQWTDRLGWMVVLASLFGAAAGIVGALISAFIPGFSTGPTIALCISLIALLSLFFAPNRGMVWERVRQERNRRQLRTESVLTDLFALSLQHSEASHPHSISVLRAMNAGRGGVRNSLVNLEERGLVRQTSQEEWSLTDEGYREVRQRAGDSVEDLS